ncbi:MAG: adenine deaminase [Clostridiales bacterium]|nr:adenine deaminase [Clostridiales bacterium]
MLKELISVAAGRKKADLVLKNCRIVNVFTGEIEEGDIAVYGGHIAGVGNYNGAETVIDCGGRYAMPGFIDAHVHIESTHLSPAQFARTVVPRGTTTVIADPHEIANVCGIEGIRYIYEESKKLPLDVRIMFPSCVPATPFETSGAALSSAEMEEHLLSGIFHGVGEMMNFPGVIFCDDEVLKKIELTRREGRVIDGHAPGLSGERLNAYLAAGIKTDHECTSKEEMLEKLSKGMYVLIREGSATQNLEELIKSVTPYNMRRCLLCTDDKTPHDLEAKGHLDHSIRLAAKYGIPFASAVCMATLNAAEAYGLKDRGAIAPGYLADIVIADSALTVERVYKNGRLVAEGGMPLFETGSCPPKSVLGTVRIKDISIDKLKIRLKGNRAKVIKIIEKSIVTDSVVREVSVKDGCFVPGGDLLKLAVVERHKGTGNVGMGILEGFGLKGGAIATSVAHDSHNLIVVGDDDGDMLLAIRELERVGGGITLCSGGKVLKTLSLEIGGLLSTLPAGQFSKRYSELQETAYRMGVSYGIEPFMTLSFMSLSVIPHLKVTDLGLFDVDKFAFTEIDA